AVRGTRKDHDHGAIAHPAAIAQLLADLDAVVFRAGAFYDVKRSDHIASLRTALHVFGAGSAYEAQSHSHRESQHLLHRRSPRLGFRTTRVGRDRGRVRQPSKARSGRIVSMLGAE